MNCHVLFFCNSVSSVSIFCSPTSSSVISFLWFLLIDDTNNAPLSVSTKENDKVSPKVIFFLEKFTKCSQNMSARNQCMAEIFIEVRK